MASSRPGPSHHQHPKPLLDLEIIVVSAKHLKNVNWRNGDLKPYAVAYLDPDHRFATKPDESGSIRPVWNERLFLPLPHETDTSSILTLDIFHSKPSETPKPLVGSTRVPLKELLDLGDFFPSPAGPSPIKTLELRRPSGRPQGKVRIKVALRERPVPTPPPPPPQEQNYQMPPPSSAYYYSTAPSTRDYRAYSPPLPLGVGINHYSNPVPSQYGPYSRGGGFSDPYSGYYSSAGGGGGYYSTAPPAPLPVRSVYYEQPANYSGPSAPVDYSPSLYEKQPQQQQQNAKGSKMGMGTGLAMGAVAGTLGALALEEGIKYEEGKIADRVESDNAARDDYSDYHADY